MSTSVITRRPHRLHDGGPAPRPSWAPRAIPTEPAPTALTELQTARPAVAERILLVGSSGGHLTQLLRLRPWWEQHERAWVTFDTPDATTALAQEQDVTWAFHPTTRNIPNLMRNTKLAVSVMRRFRPTVIVSTGAGVAVPYFAMARTMGAQTAYVEVFDRVETPTMTGRLVAPFTDLMMVQWPEQAALYDNALVVGKLL